MEHQQWLACRVRCLAICEPIPERCRLRLLPLINQFLHEPRIPQENGVLKHTAPAPIVQHRRDGLKVLFIPLRRLLCAGGEPELTDRRRVVRLRERPVFKIIPDRLQHLVRVRPSGKLRAGDRVPLRIVNVQNDLAAFLADKIAERVHLCLCRHDSKIDASALRRNADVAFLHKAHHAAAVISAAVVLAQRVNDIPMVDRPVSARPALVPPGEIQPRAVQKHIARLAPLVRPPEIVERSLIVLFSLLCRRLICAGREFHPICIIPARIFRLSEMIHNVLRQNALMNPIDNF